MSRARRRNYTRAEDTSEYAKKGEYRLLEQGFMDLPTQVEAEDVTVEFERGSHRRAHQVQEAASA
jgi:hypothetical protein